MAHKDEKTIIHRLLTGFLTEEDAIKAELEWLLKKPM
jgi:hypothetical protein